MADKVDSLTINLSGTEPDSISLDSFVKIIREARGLLQDFDENHTLAWKITAASLSSPLMITLEAEPVTQQWDHTVVDDYLAVFREVERRPLAPRIPARKVSRRVKTIINTLTDGMNQIAFSSPGRETVRAIRQTPLQVPGVVTVAVREYRDLLEIDGILETATIAGGMRFFLRDPLNNHRTECIVEREQFNDALEAMKSPVPRVSVFGLARYENDKPATIKVDSLEVLPSLDQHPGLYAVQGINITGGIESTDYVRSIRDDD